MKTILGLHVTGSQSSAAIVSGGKVICGAAEERFTREKRSRAFPSRAIKWCLGQIGAARLDDVDAVAVAYNPVSNIRRINMSGFTSWRRYDPEWLYIVPNNLAGFYDKNNLSDDCSALDMFSSDDSRNKIFFVNHHMAHAADAFYNSLDGILLLYKTELGSVFP